MAKGKKRRTSVKTVPHPRYGNSSIPSPHNVDESTIRNSYWAYASETIFPKSAIPANTAKQNFTTFPRGYYVDILKTCRGCGNKFIFFAIEQQHWYEVLGFYVDADCVRCPQCRAVDRECKMRQQRFSKTVRVAEPSDETLETLISDVVFLWRNGMYQNENGLRRIRNLANKRLPESVKTLEINELVSSLVLNE